MGEFDIDYAALANPKRFNEKFIVQGLGELKETKITKLLSAVRDLKSHDKSHPPGTVFDNKNKCTFRLGKGMAIPAFELALKEMTPGDTASLVARSDYAYGKNGG